MPNILDWAFRHFFYIFKIIFLKALSFTPNDSFKKVNVIFRMNENPTKFYVRWNFHDERNWQQLNSQYSKVCMEKALSVIH